MGRVRSLGLRASRGIGWRLTLAGTRLSALAVIEGEVEARGESIDASSLLRNGWTAPQVDVLFYFPETVSKIYQLEQWLPVIAAHSGDLNFGIVTRARSAWTELMSGDLPAPSFLAMPFPGLMDLYRVLQPKAIIYPNNGLRNFQSLVWPEAVHIHVNHGESDKVSMVSNQAKAYDKVFVAGEAAVRRHRAALVDFDESTLVKVGRPQLDLNPAPSLPLSSRRTVLYAPTWEGEDEMNNFTSLDRYGRDLIEALLTIADVRVIYKPHPRVAFSMMPAVAAAHAEVVARRTVAAAADPGAGHQYRADGDILALFPRVDLLVSDISSVGLDFLYSRAEAPIVLTDRRTNRAGLLREAPIAAACHIIDADSIATARADIAALLAADRFGADRARLRAFYFDDAAPGESTRKFHEALLAAIAEHQEGLADMRRLASHGIWPVNATELL
ncbi:MAG TPA: CDP-glycerol glycerophosphotransferase family protein [Dermatophilaceae bacterium]|nr:CDP-glycerol glycerophosphotransferase family protein [Dermatophilaceae bacterium]